MARCCMLLGTATDVDRYMGAYAVFATNGAHFAAVDSRFTALNAHIGR